MGVTSKWKGGRIYFLKAGLEPLYPPYGYRCSAVGDGQYKQVLDGIDRMGDMDRKWGPWIELEDMNEVVNI